MPKQKPPKPEAEVNESEPGADWFAPFTTPGKRVKLNAALISKDEQNRIMAESPNPLVEWDVFWHLTNAPDLMREGAKLRVDRKRGGKKAADTNRNAAATWHADVEKRARRLLASGINPRELAGKLAQTTSGVTADSIRRHLRKAGIK